MSRNQGAIVTGRATNWRDQAICTADPDAMFPGTSRTGIEAAKEICRRCPVIQECGEWALDTRQDYGICGGLTAGERRSILRRKQRRNLDDAAVAAVDKARAPEQPPRTLRNLVEANTDWLQGGHLGWTGSKKVHFGGQIYTPKQACFTVDRGRQPNGQVTSDCGITACVLPRHLIDMQEREQWRAQRKDRAAHAAVPKSA